MGDTVGGEFEVDFAVAVAGWVCCRFLGGSVRSVEAGRGLTFCASLVGFALATCGAKDDFGQVVEAGGRTVVAGGSCASRRGIVWDGLVVPGRSEEELTAFVVEVTSLALSLVASSSSLLELLELLDSTDDWFAMTKIREFTFEDGRYRGPQVCAIRTLSAQNRAPFLCL